jgi:hypothetical protein
MIFVIAITIVSDLYLPIKDWLKATHGHHWVGKGIWTVVLFVFFATVSYPLFKRNVCELTPRMVNNAAHVAVFATLAITAFFVYEYMNH